MPQEPNLEKVNDAIDDLRETMDGWGNVLTGLGEDTRDRRMGAAPSKTVLTVERIEALYQCDDIAAKIVNLKPKEMMRAGYALQIEGDEDGAIAKQASDVAKLLRVDQKVESLFKLSRLYGGAAILKGMISNGRSFTPRSVKSFTVLDNQILSADSTSIINDLKSPWFGLPEFYRITNSSSAQDNSKIHRSRLIIVHGDELPRRMMADNGYWGQSVLIRAYNALRNFNTGYDSMSTILTDFIQAVFKIKDLNSILKRGADGEALIRTRLRLVNLLKSVVNAVVIQENEEYEKKTSNVSGLADLLKMLNNRLVAATDTPHTILLGESPSGLGASGNSEKTAWYDSISSEQENKAEPVLREIYDIILFQITGEIPQYIVDFNPLWQMDEKEKADIRKLMSEADGNYLDRAVLGVSEVRNSRWGTGEFSIDTAIDLETDLETTPTELDEENNEE